MNGKMYSSSVVFCFVLFCLLLPFLVLGTEKEAEKVAASCWPLPHLGRSFLLVDKNFCSSSSSSVPLFLSFSLLYLRILVCTLSNDLTITFKEKKRVEYRLAFQFCKKEQGKKQLLLHFSLRVFSLRSSFLLVWTGLAWLRFDKRDLFCIFGAPLILLSLIVVAFDPSFHPSATNAAALRAQTRIEKYRKKERKSERAELPERRNDKGNQADETRQRRTH